MKKVLTFSIEDKLYERIKLILKQVAYVKLNKMDEAIDEADHPIMILTSCNYYCDLSFCSKKFYFLFQNKEIPFFILRSIYIKNDIEVPPGFFLCSFLEYRLSKAQERILSLIKESKYCASSAKYLPPSHPLSRIIMAQRRVVEDPQAISYLSDICEELKVSTSWLSKKFKEIFGISFCQLLAKVKCCHALYELISSDKLIKEIALNISYRPLYFSQLFHFNFGVPPSSIRKLIVPILIPKNQR